MINGQTRVPVKKAEAWKRAIASCTNLPFMLGMMLSALKDSGCPHERELGKDVEAFIYMRLRAKYMSTQSTEVH